jgi:ABC-type Fe3+-siderophore transport system permease subunit
MEMEAPAPDRSARAIPGGRQRLGGGAMALVSAGWIAWTWYTALTAGYYYRKAAMIFPAFLVIGVALVLIPAYREERIARGEDISRLHGRDLITPRWWAVIGIAVAAGFANWYLVGHVR